MRLDGKSRTHARGGSERHIQLGSAPVDPETANRMQPAEYVKQYLNSVTKSDADRLVDVLIGGIRSGAILVRLLGSLPEAVPDRFLLCWRTAAISDAGHRTPGEKFQAANTALPKRYLKASVSYRNRHRDGVDNTVVEQHFRSRVEEYKSVGVRLRFGGRSCTKDDTRALPYQLSEWTLQRLLLEDGRPPDDRTARFILAVLEAAPALGNASMPQADSSDRSGSDQNVAEARAGVRDPREAAAEPSVPKSPASPSRLVASSSSSSSCAADRVSEMDKPPQSPSFSSEDGSVLRSSAMRSPPELFGMESSLLAETSPSSDSTDPSATAQPRMKRAGSWLEAEAKRPGVSDESDFTDAFVEYFKSL